MTKAGENTFRFGGLMLRPLTLHDTVNWIHRRSLDERSAVVVTPNIWHLLLAANHEEFRAVLARADLQVADGWPLVAASRLLGEPLPERVAGVDLVERLLFGPNRFRLAILGGTEATSHILARRAEAQQQVVLIDALAENWARRPLALSLHQARPNLVLLGIGAPKQELLADYLREFVHGPIICCGAAIEILAGCRRRAPGRVQAIGLEWAWRMALEPRRLGGRYLRAGSHFLGTFAREWADR